ncbi:hypothetical protein HBH92_195960 [Parastagonospora nodorum]|nr:hypothetical protein HBH92_195960 [Parastagonospora nodorum]KAH4420666.1 hypothetical protein HBH93_204170 [Parastagonospora nodorum]KAH4433916.1 hypothetical protein HBH91_213460 [Parastagonospora nodorum]KAH4485900.1 hypothetical protein HBH89_214610 [Parastagonospora nodorum]KAH4529952.1 hypothetical protein HBH85_195220 [Parastagonospora nodorum]
MSITDMAHCDTYLALSYVWGSTRGLNLQKQNLADLLMPRSLNHHWPQIPRTIRDAIILTAKLGFRYLWVDALCIVQNDKEGKMRDIERMAAIYCKAQFTIVAAGGNNADHGLTGAGESPRSLCHQIILRFSPSAEFIIYPSQTLDESATKYFQRAWTFQEYRLPNRLLVFFNGTASWKCRRLECSEGLMGPRQMLHLPRNGLKSDSTWPNFTQYTDLVAAYNGRELSYEGDSLSAFSGVLEAIQHQFPSGFIQALPEFYFDLALLWQPRKPLRRRPSDLDFATPSWSWIGWSGSLDMRYCEHGFEHPILPLHSDYSTSWSAMCHPVTDWYKTTGPFDKRYPVNNGYIMYHKLRVGRVDNSPNQDELKETQFVPSDITETGWHVSKHFEKWPKGRSEAQLYYRSPLISEAFSYPLPLGQGPKMVQSQKITYLHFSSHRAWFFVTESSVKAVSSRITCVTVSIADASGQLVGVMRLNSTDAPNFGEAPCELVAISRSTADLDLFHDRAPLEEASDTAYLMQIITFRGMRLPLGTTPDDYRALQKIVGIYEYYNVLWIEWENGIAYRKALGRICKEAWEAQDPEKIDVLLG